MTVSPVEVTDVWLQYIDLHVCGTGVVFNRQVVSDATITMTRQPKSLYRSMVLVLGKYKPLHLIRYLL